MRLAMMSMRTLLRVSLGLLALASAAAGQAQSPPSAQRAPASLETRVKSMEEHYSSGRYMPAMVVGKRMCMQEGVVRACVVAGEILEKGTGVTANPLEAAKLYGRACIEKDKALCLRAAELYLALVAKEPVPDGMFAEDWIGLSESEAAYGAMNAFYSVCDLGDGQACYKAASMYQTRLMGKRALRAYDKGCELGHAESCNGHADLLHWGLSGPDGITSSPEGAKVYYRKACALGDKKACAKAK